MNGPIAPTPWPSSCQRSVSWNGFFAVVVTGNGAKIVDAVIALKGQLNTA